MHPIGSLTAPCHANPDARRHHSTSQPRAERTSVRSVFRAISACAHGASTDSGPIVIASGDTHKKRKCEARRFHRLRYWWRERLPPEWHRREYVRKGMQQGRRWGTRARDSRWGYRRSACRLACRRCDRPTQLEFGGRRTSAGAITCSIQLACIGDHPTPD